MAALHDIFAVCKFLFGLSALGALIGIGLGLLWFCFRVPVRHFLQGQPTDRFPLLRKVFLEL